MSDSMNLVDVLGQGGKLAASQFGLSSIDNLVNLGLTLFTPKPPKPTDLKLEKYNTDLNVNDRLSSVDNTVGNYNRSLAGMGLGAGAEAAAKLGVSTNAMTQKNQIFADKENYKNSMLNKNVDLNNQELSYNNQLGNNYENALYQHKLQKLGAISGNVSDFVSGGVNALKTGIDFNMDINKAMMIAKANPEVAANMLDIPIFATLAKKDPAFAAGIRQAIINNKRGDKAAQWNQMFPNDQIDSTWSSYGGQQAVDAADLADIERLSKLGPYAFGEDKPAAQTTNPSGELVSSYDIAQPQAGQQAQLQAETGLMSLMTPEEQQMYNTNPEYKAYIDQAGEAGIQIWRDKNKRPQEEISNVAPLETPRVSSGLGDYAVQRPNYAPSAPSTSTPSLTEEQRLNSLKTQAETELETARLNSLEQQAKEGEKWANSEEYKKMYGAPNNVIENPAIEAPNTGIKEYIPNNPKASEAASLGINFLSRLNPKNTKTVDEFSYNSNLAWSIMVNSESFKNLSEAEQKLVEDAFYKEEARVKALLIK